MKPNDKAIEAARKVVIQRATHNSFNPSFLFGVIEAALDAAYAAQFQSGDYAGLVERLKNLACEMASVNDAIGEKFVEINEAADALEAVLVEREAWKGRQKDTATILKQVEDERDALKAANNELREENELVGKQMDKFADQIESLETERDDLAARLAPVDDEALVERDALKKAVEAEQSMTKLRLGPFLKKVRQEKQMTLRAVEEATDKEISNAYLSQLESGKIANPSPHVLYTLSLVFGVAYETLMERAGYIMPAPNRLAPVGAIENDKDDPTREYIPLPGGWEIQTKGKGSSYRLLDKKTGERHMILTDDALFVQEFVTRMAKEINLSYRAQHVAPVDDEALVEIVAREIAFAQGDVESPNSEFMDENWHCWEPEARAAIAAIRPHIEAAEREKWQKMLARMGAGTTKTGAVNE